MSIYHEKRTEPNVKSSSNKPVKDPNITEQMKKLNIQTTMGSIDNRMMNESQDGVNETGDHRKGIADDDLNKDKSDYFSVLAKIKTDCWKHIKPKPGGGGGGSEEPSDEEKAANQEYGRRGLEALKDFEKIAKENIMKNMGFLNGELTDRLGQEVQSLTDKFKDALGGGFLGNIIGPGVSQELSGVLAELDEKIREMTKVLGEKTSCIPQSRGERLGKVLPELTEGGGFGGALDQSKLKPIKPPSDPLQSPEVEDQKEESKEDDVGLDSSEDGLNLEEYTIESESVETSSNKLQDLAQKATDHITKKGKFEVHNVITGRIDEMVENITNEMLGKLDSFVKEMTEKLTKIMNNNKG